MKTDAVGSHVQLLIFAMIQHYSQNLGKKQSKSERDGSAGVPEDAYFASGRRKMNSVPLPGVEMTSMVSP